MLPTTPPTWDLLDLNPLNTGAFLSLGGADVVFVEPTGFSYQEPLAPDLPYIRVESQELESYADFQLGVPSNFTLDVVLRSSQLPTSTADLTTRRLGITVGDDAGRGLTIYFSALGFAVSRIDDFGSVTVLPESQELLTESDYPQYMSLRVAVNASLGRAYIYMQPQGEELVLRYIVPVEATPATVGNRLRLFCLGTDTDPAVIEFESLRLGTGINIPNFPPTADGGPDKVIAVGQSVTLNGRNSSDPEGALLSYSWKAVDAPYGSDFAYDASDGSTQVDGGPPGFTTILDVTASSLPVWVAEGDILVVNGARYVIESTTASTIVITERTLPDDLVTGPFRIIRQSLVVGATTEQPYVVPDIQGLYRFQLTVNDGELDSEPFEVLVSVVGARTPFGVEPDVSPMWSALGDDWQLIEGRELFEEFWKGTAQLLGGYLLQVWQHHYNGSLRDAQRQFQRKWVAYRTLVTETAPEDALLSGRWGPLLATYDWTVVPALTGLTIILEVYDGVTTTSVTEVTTTFTGDVLATAVSDINTALAAAGVSGVLAYGFPSAAPLFLGIRGLKGIQVTGGSALAVLGFPTTLNYLQGVAGALVTDRCYRVDDGINLQIAGVQPGDLLVTNNGQSFTVDRLLDSVDDGTPYQRLQVVEPLPLDVTSTWQIPSLLTSAEVDYETELIYPGDLLKVEIFDNQDSSHHTGTGVVVAPKNEKVAINLQGLQGPLTDSDRYSLRILGIKRRRAIPIHEDTLSIPQLQTQIPLASATLLYENIDYLLEPLYRNADETGIPALQFRDSVWVDSELEPPDILWAELTWMSNYPNIENLFGRLISFTRDNALAYEADVEYLSAVSGLMYAHERGPTPHAMRVGAQILLGQPFAEVAGEITEIRSDYTPLTTRILVRDSDGNTPSQSEVIRSYVIKKDPLDLGESSGIEVNPDTGVPYVVGDTISQFQPLGTGVEVKDYVNSPGWWIPYRGTRVMTEIEKFFKFLLRFDLALVDIVNLSLLQQFIYRVKPTYTQMMLVGLLKVQDDVDPDDTFTGTLIMHQYDRPHTDGPVYMFGDYRGDGSQWSTFGDGTPVGEYQDHPEDHIQWEVIVTWPGGPITFGDPFWIGVEVEDTSGAHTGTPGLMFDIEFGMTLEAGTYTLLVVIDPGSNI